MLNYILLTLLSVSFGAPSATKYINNGAAKIALPNVSGTMATDNNALTFTNKLFTSPIITGGSLNFGTIGSSVISGSIFSLGTLSGSTLSSGTVTSSQASNINITSGTASLNKVRSNHIEFTKLSSSPNTPGSGTLSLYIKDDNKAYLTDSTGTDIGLGSAGDASNILTNASFSSGTSGHTLPAGTAAIETSFIVPPDSQSLRFSLSSTSGTILSQVIQPTGSLGGVNLESSLYVATTVGSLEVCAMQGTSAVQCNDVPTSGKWSYVPANMAGPSSGSIGYALRTKDAVAVTGTVYAARAYTGTARNLYEVSQAQLFGKLAMPAASSCTWDQSPSLGSFTDLPANSACDPPTLTGAALAPDTEVPGIKFASIPPGRYVFVVRTLGGYMAAAAGSETDVGAVFRLYDGTNGIGGSNVRCIQASFCTDAEFTGEIEYTTTQTNVTIRLQAMESVATTTDIGVANNNTGSNGSFEISVYRYPTQNETVARSSNNLLPTIQKFTSGSGTYVRPSGVSYIRVRMVGGGGGGGGSGTASRGAGAAGGLTTFGSLSANGGGAGGSSGGAGGAGTLGIGIGDTFTGSSGAPGANTNGVSTIYLTGGQGGSSVLGSGGRGGESLVAGYAAGGYGSGGGGGGGNTFSSFVLGGGGGAGGYVEAIITLPSSSYSYAVGSAGTAGNAGTSGYAGGAGTAGYIEVTEFYGLQNSPIFVGSVTSNTTGMERSERAEINCDASSSVTSQSGTWISSIGNRSGAGCALTIASGIFSATPVCTVTIKSATVQAMGASMSSATAGTIYGPSADYDAYVRCEGPR